ncbi:MAG: ACT domain-containing protein [Eubacteriales bacterium]
MNRSSVTIFMLVDNEFGVLTRITALLRREGFNIMSLAVEVTENPEISQLLVSVECMDTALPRVLGRLNKLGCVKDAVVADARFDLSCHLKEIFSGLHDMEKGGAGNGR